MWRKNSSFAAINRVLLLAEIIFYFPNSETHRLSSRNFTKISLEYIFFLSPSGYIKPILNKLDISELKFYLFHEVENKGRQGSCLFSRNLSPDQTVTTFVSTFVSTFFESRCCDMLRWVWIHLNFVSTSSQNLFCSWNVKRLLRLFDRTRSHGISQHVSTQMLRECYVETNVETVWSGL